MNNVCLKNTYHIYYKLLAYNQKPITRSGNQNDISFFPEPTNFPLNYVRTQTVEVL